MSLYNSLFVVHAQKFYLWVLRYPMRTQKREIEEDDLLFHFIENDDQLFVRHMVSRYPLTMLQRNKSHYMPLHYAVLKQRHEIVKTLLLYGALVNATFCINEYGCRITALSIAVTNEDQEMIDILMAYDASFVAVCANGKTVYQNASDFGLCLNPPCRFSSTKKSICIF